MFTKKKKKKKVYHTFRKLSHTQKIGNEFGQKQEKDRKNLNACVGLLIQGSGCILPFGHNLVASHSLCVLWSYGFCTYPSIVILIAEVGGGGNIPD